TNSGVIGSGASKETPRCFRMADTPAFWVTIVSSKEPSRRNDLPKRGTLLWTGGGFKRPSSVTLPARRRARRPFLRVTFPGLPGNLCIGMTYACCLCAGLCDTIERTMIELLIILCLVLAGLVVWTLYQQNRKPDAADPALTLIQQEM